MAMLSRAIPLRHLQWAALLNVLKNVTMNPDAKAITTWYQESSVSLITEPKRQNLRVSFTTLSGFIWENGLIEVSVAWLLRCINSTVEFSIAALANYTSPWHRFPSTYWINIYSLKLRKDQYNIFSCASQCLRNYDYCECCWIQVFPRLLSLKYTA